MWNNVPQKHVPQKLLNEAVIHIDSLIGDPLQCIPGDILQNSHQLIEEVLISSVSIEQKLWEVLLTNLMDKLMSNV